MDAGELELRYEPETGFMRVVFPPGKLSEATARAVVERLARHQVESRGEPTFTLVDCRAVTGIGPEARGAFGAVNKPQPGAVQPESYIASYGGSSTFRVVGNLLIKGLMILTKQMVLTLEADEVDARKWLTRQRSGCFERNEMIRSVR